MIKEGVSEQDIKFILNNPDNDSAKKSFLSKYGVDLAKITCAVVKL